ncbi:hypothetical protein Anapl_02016 [Anas platyrhynchos]|uniref:Uncharacterized protein n=1 Tax=Anas platyrhynchos TaxID=8839 RepID=R0M4D1_ANAPL|nr:hypothetical protein Anapl_02016 [Anas platyrhynchos]
MAAHASLDINRLTAMSLNLVHERSAFETLNKNQQLSSSAAHESEWEIEEDVENISHMGKCASYSGICVKGPLCGRYFRNIMPNASNAITDGRATGHVVMLVGGYPSSLLFSSRGSFSLPVEAQLTLLLMTLETTVGSLSEDCESLRDLMSMAERVNTLRQKTANRSQSTEVTPPWQAKGCSRCLRSVAQPIRGLQWHHVTTMTTAHGHLLRCWRPFCATTLGRAGVTRVAVWLLGVAQILATGVHAEPGNPFFTGESLQSSGKRQIRRKSSSVVFTGVLKPTTGVGPDVSVVLARMVKVAVVFIVCCVSLFKAGVKYPPLQVSPLAFLPAAHRKADELSGPISSIVGALVAHTCLYSSKRDPVCTAQVPTVQTKAHAKKRCVVLHNFAAGDKVQSQKLQAQQEIAHVDLFAPRFSRGAAPEVPKVASLPLPHGTPPPDVLISGCVYADVSDETPVLCGVHSAARQLITSIACRSMVLYTVKGGFENSRVPAVITPHIDGKLHIVALFQKNGVQLNTAILDLSKSSDANSLCNFEETNQSLLVFVHFLCEAQGELYIFVHVGVSKAEVIIKELVGRRRTNSIRELRFLSVHRIQWQQEGSEPIVSGLVSFLFALGSSATTQWLKKAGKSFPGTWHWDGPQSFCRALVGRLLLSSQQQAVATGYHWPWALPPSWLHFPTERCFYRMFSEGKRQATPAQKCRGAGNSQGVSPKWPGHHSGSLPNSTTKTSESPLPSAHRLPGLLASCSCCAAKVSSTDACLPAQHRHSSYQGLAAEAQQLERRGLANSKVAQGQTGLLTFGSSANINVPVVVLWALLCWLCFSCGKRSQKAISVIDQNVQVNEDGQGKAEEPAGNSHCPSTIFGCCLNLCPKHPFCTPVTIIHHSNGKVKKHKRCR